MAEHKVAIWFSFACSVNAIGLVCKG